MDLTKLSQQISEISGTINRLFEKDKLNKISKETGFVKRQSATLTPHDFLQLMTTELLKEPTLSYGGLCDCLKTLNPEVSLTSQGFEDRVNRPESVEYLRRIFEQAMNLTIQPICQNISSELLNPFPQIFLQDSTQFTLNEQLAHQFKGAGGSGTKAGCKLDVVYELKNQKITHLQMSKATIPDQSRASNFLDWIEENELIIRDLGYFALDALQECQNKKAYFLSRLLQCTDVYLRPDSPEPINLCNYANKNSPNSSVIELSVFIGKSARIPVRLIMYRSPQSIVSRRRQEAIKNAKKKGRTPSQEYLALLEFTLFITNVPASIWSAEVVGTIYRIRWLSRVKIQGMEISVVYSYLKREKAGADFVLALWPINLLAYNY